MDRVVKAGAVFDIEKLRWFNAQYLHALPPDALLAVCSPYLLAAGIDTDDTERGLAIVRLLASYLTVPADIVPLLRPFAPGAIDIGGEEAQSVMTAEQTPVVLQEFIRKAAEIANWKAADIKAAISDIQKETGIKGKPLFMPIRFALTGEGHGPDLGATAEILGRDVCIARATAALH